MDSAARNLPSAPIASPASPNSTRDLVVLIHGIASSKYLLAPLGRRLRAMDFETQLHTYFTLRGSIRDIGGRFAAKLHRLAEQNPERKIHVVAHSMGSIVTRCAVLAGVPDNLGRIVMVGAPNRGSHMARKLSPYYGWLSSTLCEMSDVPESFVNALPLSVDRHDVGIVTAASDYLVPAESTLLDTYADHITLPGLHVGVLWKKETAGHVANFLRTGKF
jgi:pimeloyl-ACP methyl ester carboxylesterase